MKIIHVDEEYQTGYEYTSIEPIGKNFREDFKPELTPKEMLDLGIFGGNYFIETPNEFPKEWFTKTKFSDNFADNNLNFYKVNASMSLNEWLKRGWIYPEDPKGWFLWYCRYYYGRRIEDEDERQIKRWKNMKRHIIQLKNHCQSGDLNCRRRQRQSLLHWAYDSRKM